MTTLHRKRTKPGHRSWAARGQRAPGKHDGDIMSPQTRSRLMARIRGMNTGPENTVAALLSKRGIACKRHDRYLPGRPDFVFPDARLVVFVDGDFWHGWRFPLWRHKLSAQWATKIEANRARDSRNFRRLRHRGWTVLRLWEHQVEQAPHRCLRCIQSKLAILRVR